MNSRIKEVDNPYQTQTVVVRIGHRRGRQEGVAEGTDSKRKQKLKRITLRSVIKLSTRLRCARTGSSLMGNFAGMATNASSLMVIMKRTCRQHLFITSISLRIALNSTMSFRSHAPMAFVASSFMKNVPLKKFISSTMYISSMK